MIEQIYAYFTIEILYFWVNLGVLPFWLVLIFFPQSNFTKYFVTSIFPVTLLGGAYIFVLYKAYFCLLYTSPSPRDGLLSRMPSSA